MKRMLVMMALLVVGVAGYAPPAGAQAPAVPVPHPPGVPLKIESAMSAAPLAIAGDATIVDYPAEAGQPFVTLRQGTNGWTCYPDRPDTPGNDPQCLDATWQAWLQAFESGNVPNVTAPGFAYKLQGGSEASSTTPYALEPGQGEAWVTTPRQIMLLLPGRLDPTMFSTTPASDRPFIMWAGSAFEYLVIPVQNDPVDDMMAFPFEGLNSSESMIDTSNAPTDLMAFPFEGLYPNAAPVDTPALGGYSQDMEPGRLASPKPATDTSSSTADPVAFPFWNLYAHPATVDTPALGGYWQEMEPRHLASPKPATDTSNTPADLMAFPFEGLYPNAATVDTSNTPPAGLDANGPHLGSYAIPYPSADPDGHNRPPALHYAIPYPNAATPDTTSVAAAESN